MDNDSIWVVLFTALLAFFAFFLIASIILYVFQAIGLFKIAKREGKGDIAWLAWIPFVGQFLMTLLVEQDVQPGLRGKYTLLYALALVSSIMLSYFVPFITLVPWAMLLYAFYLIAKRYSDNPVLHLVIAIITFSISIPIQLFMFRNRKLHTDEEIILDLLDDDK